MSVYTLKCGCTALVEFERLVTTCPKHEAEWKELHENAARDRLQQDAVFASKLP